VAADFALPFELEQVAGTVPVGRPAVWEDVLYEYAGEPIRGTTLVAAYRVTGESPVAVIRLWAAQLDSLDLERVTIRSGENSGAWVQAFGHSTLEFQPDQSKLDSADLQLWTTRSQPILLISITRASDDQRSPEVVDDAGDPPEPAPVVADDERGPGDELFTEKGHVMHLPPGTRTLMPTLPVTSGTGGSASVLAADDGPAAVQALLDEAVRIGRHDGASEVIIDEIDEVEIAHARFVIPAGGWSFYAVSVRGPDDPHATLYVYSSAD
jgi:hypothetical protein